MHLHLLLLVAIGAISNVRGLKLSRWIASATIGAMTSCSIVATSAQADMITAPWDSNVKYEVIKEGKPGSPVTKVGDLVAIRFKGAYKGNVFDDIFTKDQPYFYRAGVGLILKGLDDAVVHMKVGDQYKLEFGGDLAFGEKGRPSSPGKPRIPPNAPVEYEVLVEDMPGTQEGYIADFDDIPESSDD